MRLKRWLVRCIFLLSGLGLGSCQAIGDFFTLPPTEPWLTPSELAVIVNEADPLSVQIGEYYQQQRRIPARNLIRVRFNPEQTVLSPEEFEQVFALVNAKIPPYTQAFALTWAVPYRVGCMSITSAFAFGFDSRYCAEGCQPTKPSPYYKSNSIQPHSDLKVRPAMAIAATSFEQAKALIDRGIAADYSAPKGTAYLVSTSDASRNVRANLYAPVSQYLGGRFAIQQVKADSLTNKPDVMFYFTGLAQVRQLDSNRFLPGAIADHLTSAGGMLTDSGQMSSLRWLEAGATGSYGAVVEPCNFVQKFPQPGIVIYYYLQGETLLEAYWKSVAWPGQGIFIGEPLARPFGNPNRHGSS